jgi:hypothetical protein
MLVSRMFTAFCVSLSDTIRHGPAPEGMAGLRHKQRHKNDTGHWTPYGSIPTARRAPGAPAREGGLVLASSQIPDLRNDGCKFIPEQRRQAVGGNPHAPAPQHRSQLSEIHSTARARVTIPSTSQTE